jgi:hypothetical protein
MKPATSRIAALSGIVFSLVRAVPPHLNDSVSEAANSLRDLATAIREISAEAIRAAYWQGALQGGFTVAIALTLLLILTSSRKSNQ